MTKKKLQSKGGKIGGQGQDKGYEQYQPKPKRHEAPTDPAELATRLRNVKPLFGEKVNHTFHRFKCERLEAARVIDTLMQEPTQPQGTYTIQDQTMQRVFLAAELNDLSDLQAVFNAMEDALTTMHQEVQTKAAAAHKMHRRAQKAEGTIEKAIATLTAALKTRGHMKRADGSLVPRTPQPIRRQDIAHALKLLGGPVGEKTGGPT